jgi:hypothetical protein
MIVAGFFDAGRMVVCSPLASFSIGDGGDAGRLAVPEPDALCLGSSPARDAVSSSSWSGSLGAYLRSLVLTSSSLVPNAEVSTSRSRFSTRLTTEVVVSLALDDAEGLTVVAAEPRQDVSMRMTADEPPGPRNRRCTYAGYNNQNGSSR